MNTFLLIDAYAIIHRAFFALPELSTNEGTPTNAIYGFFTMLHKAINDFQPTHIAVCFDTPKPTFRKELFKEYQAHRPKAVDGFKVQIPLIKELLDAGGIRRIEKEGFEADDVIGTLATRFSSQEKILILTGDKDIMQLARENVFIITPQKGISTISIYGPQEVMERFGIPPELIPDFKALMGDPSDNYKGAPGIGPKTATKLLQEFKSIEHLLEHAEEVTPERVKNILTENKDSIQMSHTLARIKTDIELECKIEDFAFTGFKSPMREQLEKLQLFSLIGRLFGGKQPSLTRETAKKALPVEEKPSKKTDVDENQLDLF
jgi:DNA polymerase-1